MAASDPFGAVRNLEAVGMECRKAETVVEVIRCHRRPQRMTPNDRGTKLSRSDDRPARQVGR